MAYEQVRFPAMGTEAHILINDGLINDGLINGGLINDGLINDGSAAGLVGRAVRRVEELEGHWSRFIESSDISRMNAAPGTHRVSPDTVVLVTQAIEAWHRTAGRFDPTVYAAMVANGYDRTFDDIEAVVTSNNRDGAAGCHRPTPGCIGIVVDAVANTIVMPRGVGFDPGGIGKGLAADIVVAEAMAAGAAGALVNVGGDLRTAGLAPAGCGWAIAISEPSIGDSALARVRFVDGALATSTTAKRRWSTAGGEQHHLIDPLTGRPHDGRVTLATVIAAEAWWAEALTKQLFGADPGEAENMLHGAAALLVLEDGGRRYLGGFEEYLYGEDPEHYQSKGLLT